MARPSRGSSVSRRRRAKGGHLIPLLLSGAVSLGAGMAASPPVAAAPAPLPTAPQGAMVRLLVPLETGLELDRVAGLAPQAQVIEIAGQPYVLVGAFTDARAAYRLGRSLQKRLALPFNLAYDPGHPQADLAWLQQPEVASQPRLEPPSASSGPVLRASTLPAPASQVTASQNTAGPTPQQPQVPAPLTKTATPQAVATALKSITRPATSTARVTGISSQAATQRPTVSPSETAAATVRRPSPTIVPDTTTAASRVNVQSSRITAAAAAEAPATLRSGNQPSVRPAAKSPVFASRPPLANTLTTTATATATSQVRAQTPVVPAGATSLIADRRDAQPLRLGATRALGRFPAIGRTPSLAQSSAASLTAESTPSMTRAATSPAQPVSPTSTIGLTPSLRPSTTVVAAASAPTSSPNPLQLTRPQPPRPSPATTVVTTRSLDAAAPSREPVAPEPPTTPVRVSQPTELTAVKAERTPPLKIAVRSTPAFPSAAADPSSPVVTAAAIAPSPTREETRVAEAPVRPRIRLPFEAEPPGASTLSEPSPEKAGRNSADAPQAPAPGNSLIRPVTIAGVAIRPTTNPELFAVNRELLYLYVALPAPDQADQLQQLTPIATLHLRNGQLLAQVGTYQPTPLGRQLLDRDLDRLASQGFRGEVVSAMPQNRTARALSANSSSLALSINRPGQIPRS